MTRFTFTNWAGNHCSSPLRRHRVRGDQHIAEIIARARAAGETVKAVGAGHSWTDIACTDGHLLSLDEDCELIAMDLHAHTVTVRAGIRLRDLSELLLRRGLALSNLGSIAEQSIAGAIATGTHGTGLGFGNLATQVIGLRLITAAGEILDLSATREPELFSAAQVSLGCLGIISQVTIQCEPAFHLRERSQPMAFDEAMRDLPTLVEGHDHTKLWWLPHTDTVQVSSYDRTTAPISPGAELQHAIEHHRLMTWLLGGMTELGRRLPAAVPRLNRMVAPLLFRPVDRVNRSHRLFATVMPAPHFEAEFAIPYARTAEAAERLRALIRTHDLRVNFIQELRFVAADDIMMSPAFARDSCHVGGYIGACRDTERFLRHFEALMLDLDGRPHWGKVFAVGHDELKARLPNFERFAAIRARLDPDGVFVNRFIRRIFGL
jgi:L-gulonolactone oxidase